MPILAGFAFGGGGGRSIDDLPVKGGAITLFENYIVHSWYDSGSIEEIKNIIVSYW